MSHAARRPLAGLALFVAIVAIVVVAATLFRGGFTPTAPITVITQRVGLVMNPDAKVTMRGVQVGRVSSIESLANGQAALHLAMDPSQLDLIPANVDVDIASTTAFGAKLVQFVPPDDPAPQPLQSGQTLDARHVTVEFNTVFQQLVSVLSSIEPEKMNQTLGALAQALDGRGAKIGEAMSDVNALLRTVEPSLDALSHDVAVAPTVINAYADAAPDLLRIVDNTTQFGNTLVDEQKSLDALLVSTIGLVDVGEPVLSDNRQPLTDMLHVLVPTAGLLNEYRSALKCSLDGAIALATSRPADVPGVIVSSNFTLGIERYRYPKNLPKVAATGGPQCDGMPIGFGQRAKSVIADTGANPWQYGNQGILLNSDALKQQLFGPLDGPPRNSTQIGQPG